MTTNTRNRFVATAIAVGIVASYAASRFVGLTKLPIFIDEAIHILWSVGVWRGHPFAPLTDGKLLQPWFAALVVPWALDPLWAARAVTILGGGLALYACFHIGTRLYNRQAGFLCAALYVICPFTLFYDRMALADGLLSAFAALTLLWSIALIQDNRLYYGLLLGVAMAGAILSKMPGLLTLLTPLFAVILLAKPPRIRLARPLAVAYGITLALTVFPVIRFLQITPQGEKSVIGENAATIITQFGTNVQLAYQWLWFYWTPPVLILGIAGFVFAIAKRKREHLLLGIVSLIPVLAFTAGSRIWFPRYVLFATVPILALVAGIVTGKKGITDWIRLLRLPRSAQQLHSLPSILLLVLVGLFAWKVDWLLMTNPALAPLPAIERVQYMEGWPSGYGVAEAVHFLRQAAEVEERGIVIVHHDLGDTTDLGLRAYLIHEKRIAVRQLNIRAGTAIATLVTWSRTKPAFVMLNRPAVSHLPEEQPKVAELLKVAYLVRSYPKPGGRSFVDLYYVETPESAEPR